MTTFLGRTFVTRAPPRGPSPRMVVACPHGVAVGAHAVEEYAAKVGRLRGPIECLNADMRARIVWADPADLHAKAGSGILNGKSAAEIHAIADDLAVRAGARPPAQVAKEIRFGTDWNDFYTRWGNSYARWGKGEFRIDPFLNDWDVINGYETEFDRLNGRYATQLGYTSGCAKRVTDTDVSADPSHAADKDPFTAALEGLLTLAKWGVVGLIVVGGVMILTSVKT